MEAYTNSLYRLLDQLKTLSFWSRLFNWAGIRNLIFSASSDLQGMAERNRSLEKERDELHFHLKHANDELARHREEIVSLKKEDQFRRTELSNSMATLTKLQRDVLDDRKKETDERIKVDQEKLAKLKETWINHEEHVRQAIRSICSKHTIEYVEKVPFKGDPDNTLRICDEFIVFDAKSPAGDDLTNFPVYIRDQAEKARKYCRETGVRNEIFLVVPTNTLARMKQFVYNLADYRVYILSLDSLEPVILSLQKLEEYEFVEQLSPEERDNICRILGKFAHLTKRRIQIDTFFTKQFMELAYKCESDLPADILEKVTEFEKAEKLNPPTERRSKQINLKELETDVTRLRNETGTKGIAQIEARFSSELDKMPLYTSEYE